MLTDLYFELGVFLKKDVDLINLRMVSTVFQNIIINTGKVIFCADEYLKGMFEMLVWSFYQKLNEERAEILEDFFNTVLPPDFWIVSQFVGQILHPILILNSLQFIGSGQCFFVFMPVHLKVSF